MKAWLNLRHSVPEREKAFRAGLERLGYQVVKGTTTMPGARDILVTWNRIREGHQSALAFENINCAVIVTENATWGNNFCGDHWYTIASNYHNTANKFPIGDHGRFDNLRVPLKDFRTYGETVILAQRGIGTAPVMMPITWPGSALKKYGGRIRNHPGQHEVKPLLADLATAGRVVTWGSGGAIKALMQGIPIVSDMPNWIGAQDNTDKGRLAMLRRLAWAQWRLEEIATGEPFARLLQ